MTRIHASGPEARAKLGMAGLSGIIVSLAFALVVASGAALAGKPASQVNIDSGGYAIDRYDPVAYFTQGRPVRGRTDLTAEYEGATYAFSSEANRDLFLGDPAKYTPQYGGFCAYGVAYGTKSPIDPEEWEIVDGKLFFLINPATKSLWDRKKEIYIDRADKAWQSIARPNR